MAKGTPVQPTQTTTNEPSQQAKDIIDLAMPGIKDFAATVPNRYQGSTIAPANANQLGGESQVLGAVGAQQGTADATTAAQQQLLNNPWDPATNANLQGAITAATRPITDTLTQSTLPAIRTDAITRGGFGGSRQGLAEGAAASGAAQAVGDTANKLVTGVYNTNVDAALKAIGLAPTVQQAQVQPGITQAGVGDVDAARQQALLNELVGNFNYDQYAPYLQSKDLLGLAAGIPGGTTTSTANNPPQAPMWAQAGSGALAGASLGSAILPGAGTAVGAGLGGVLPFLLK